ncbi:DUF5709 domain-containing protein [Streptodolium elevatio]|uniref:DUF5709 domain-containing protein n=1 Tax=Streptodolium elevatio TaxID=3157996 RepID=A0ABV3DPN8_9ACTN
MSDQERGDDVYQPANSDAGNPPNDDLDLQNALGERTLDDTLDEGYSPPERPLAVEDYGTTQGEQEAGESLDRRLSREQPEVTPDPGDGIGDLAGGNGEPVDGQVGDERTGRLADDEAASQYGYRGLGHDVGIDGGAATAEEAAVHTIPDEPGA